MTDPTSGVPAPGSSSATGWHMHGSGYVHRDDPHTACGPEGELWPHTTPVLVLDLAGAREQIARAIYQAEDDFDELIEAGMMRSHRREDFLAGAVLAALASQERGK